MDDKLIEQLITDSFNFAKYKPDRPEVYESNGVKLDPYSWKGERVNYSLELPASYKKGRDDNEDEFTEGKEYFYLEVNSNPEIYRYVSKKEGGAIVFKDKGRWSGNANEFGKKEFSKTFTDVDIVGEAHMAMSSKDAESLIKRNFPELDFKITNDGTIEATRSL